MGAARRRPACKSSSSSSGGSTRRLSRRALRRSRKLARRARKRGPHFTAPVRRQIHKVSAVEAASAQSSHAGRAAVQMCEKAPLGSRRPATRHIVACEHLQTLQASARRRRRRSSARGSGPTTGAAVRLRNSKLARTQRSLAEIVAQMQWQQQHQQQRDSVVVVVAQKTIGVAQMEQRLVRKPQLGLLDIENIKLRATRSLLARDRDGNIIKFDKRSIRRDRRTGRGLEYSQGTSIVENRTVQSNGSIGSHGPRSLDNSVRFLHERQLNQQRPSVQRLGPSPTVPTIEGNNRRLQLMSTLGRSRDTAGSVAESLGQRVHAKRRLSVTRLVRPVVRSSSTQTTRISTSSGATRPAPYNTRQRAAAAASPSSISMVVPDHHHPPPPPLSAHQIQRQAAQPAAVATMAICERLGSITLQTARKVDEIDRIKASTYPRWWPWSKWDKSHECQVSEDQLGLCFHPESSESTAACRAAEPLPRSGQQYYWEIHVEEKCYGTSVMFGLCTRKQRLHVNDYCQLVGEDNQGWSLSHKGVTSHQGQKVQYTDEFPQFQALTVGLHYDTARGELSYFLNGKSLGVAFTGLNDIEDQLYPVVASTAKCTRMRLVSSRCSHMSLLDRSRYALIKSFARDRQQLIGYLRAEGAPRHLLEYVNKLTRARDCPEEYANEEAPPVLVVDEPGPASRTRSSGGAGRGNPAIRRSSQLKRGSPGAAAAAAGAGEQARRRHQQNK